MRSCKFCDSEPMIVHEKDFLTDDEAFEVKCGNWQCAVGNSVTRPNKDDAMTAWNKAQMASDTGKLRQVLKEALSEDN